MTALLNFALDGDNAAARVAAAGGGGGASKLAPARDSIFCHFPKNFLSFLTFFKQKKVGLFVLLSEFVGAASALNVISQFTPEEWHVRTDATLGKLKSYKKSELFAR